MSECQTVPVLFVQTYSLIDVHLMLLSNTDINSICDCFCPTVSACSKGDISGKYAYLLSSRDSDEKIDTPLTSVKSIWSYCQQPVSLAWLETGSVQLQSGSHPQKEQDNSKAHSGFCRGSTQRSAQSSNTKLLYYNELHVTILTWWLSSYLQRECI